MGTSKKFIGLLEVITNMFDTIYCKHCEGELPEDRDCYEWDGFKFCSEDCLYEYLEDGE